MLAVFERESFTQSPALTTNLCILPLNTVFALECDETELGRFCQ